MKTQLDRLFNGLQMIHLILGLVLWIDALFGKNSPLYYPIADAVVVILGVTLLAFIVMVGIYKRK
jgi:hypothetical protein